MAKKVIFYTDYASFGGHEIMSIEHAVLWASVVNVEFYIHKDNSALINYIENNNYHLIIKINLYSQIISSKIELLINKVDKFSYENDIKDSIFILVSGGVGSCIFGYRLAKFYKARKIYWYLPMLLVPTKVLSYIFFRFILYLYKDVITITRYQANKIVKYNKNINVLILRNFIPSSKIKNEFNNFINNKNNYIRLGFIGRCHKQKNLTRIITAINHYYSLKTNFCIDIELDLIGCDHKSEIFSELLELVKGGWRLNALPWSTRPYDNYMDGLLLPSKYEGDPLVIHECRLRKIPVFCQKLDELDEILHDTEKFDFNNKNIIGDIVKSYNKCRGNSYNISIVETKQNDKFIKESINFLGTIIENTNN